MSSAAGSFVTHFGKQIHYDDGAKGSEAALEIPPGIEIITFIGWYSTSRREHKRQTPVRRIGFESRGTEAIAREFGPILAVDSEWTRTRFDG
jgi:hypothetical protein